MLNAKQERELAYVVIIEGLEPIPGYDRVEHAIVGGWRVIVRKGQFNVGDPAIYFEIDSRVPSDRECFAFLEPRHYKVKTLKMCKTISQGLLMHPSDFGWNSDASLTMSGGIIDNEGNIHYVTDESRFLTKQLGVIYADDEDNQRKAPTVDKYKRMAARYPSIFSRKFVRKLMRYQWGKNIMFFFFGNKKKKNNWPAWVQKTDEERIQNMPWILKDEGYWVATEKIDGTSTTFTMRKGFFGKKEFYVCSRNVNFTSPNQNCFYDTNVYLEMAQKYNMKDVLISLMKKYPKEKWITIQGETYGNDVQKRNYSIKEHNLAVFNLIFSSRGRVGTTEMVDILQEYNIPCVPVLEEHMKINQFENVDAILTYAEGNSQIDSLAREGIVFRSIDGAKSFKAVSNSFLLKYHGYGN